MFDPPQPSGLLLWCCFFRSTTAATTAAAATRSSLYIIFPPNNTRCSLRKGSHLTILQFWLMLCCSSDCIVFCNSEHCILSLTVWPSRQTECFPQHAKSDHCLALLLSTMPPSFAILKQNICLNSEAGHLAIHWWVLTANPLCFPWCFWRNQRKLLRVVGQPFKLCVEFLLAIFLSLIINLHGSSTGKYFGFELVVWSREVFCIYIVIKHFCVWLACFSQHILNEMNIHTTKNTIEQHCCFYSF